MAFNQRIGRAVLELSIDGGGLVRGKEDAKAAMRDIARGIAQTQRDIQKQAFRFSGRDQIAEAAKVAAAIQRIGGIEKLTARERAQAHAILAPALEKQRLMYGQINPLIAQYEKATRNSGNATQWMTAKMTALGAAAGTFAANIAMRAVSALIAMGREAFVSAGHILDLANKSGLSARTIQEMRFVAEQTGGSIESFTNANVELGIRLQGTSKEVTEATDALRKYGVDIERLKAARPDEQWNMVAEALSRVTTAQERNRIGQALMGRQFKEISASMAEGYRTIADQAKVATDQQLRELDRLNDEWTKFKRNLTTGFGAAMGRIVLETRVRTEVVEEYFRRRREEPTFQGFPSDSDNPAARPLNVEEETQRRLQNLLVDPRTKDIALVAQQDEVLEDYVQTVKEATAELAKLDAAERAQIEAARTLGTVTDEELTQRLVRYGVEASKAKDVLKLLNGELKESKKDASSAAREWQSFIERFTDAAARTTAGDLAKAIATGQIDLARLTKEQQQDIAKALLAGAASWERWAGVVPVQIRKVLTSAEMLRMMREELVALETVLDNAGVPEGDAARATFATERDLAFGKAVVDANRTRLDAERSFSASMQELALDRAEFVIKQAERAGASRIQLLQMEEQLARQRYDVETAAAHRAFEEATRDLRLGTVEADAEYDKQILLLDAHLAKVNEAHRQASEERREEMRRETDFWLSELGRRIKGELRGAQFELTGRLASTLFGPVPDDGSKQRVREARAEFERLTKDGKASAEELTRARLALMEAELKAGSAFADRFKSIWDGIARHLFNVFDMILERFVNGLLKGMLDGLLRTSLGQKIGGWVTGMVPGLAGAAAAALPGAAAAPALATLLGPAPVAAAATAATTTTATTTAAAGGGLAAAAPFAVLAAPFAAAWLGGYWGGTPLSPAQLEQLKRYREGTGRPALAGLFDKQRLKEFGGTFHTGGVVGFGNTRPTAGFDARARILPRLKQEEVLIKVLKGEAVLTPKATQMLGGKPAIDAINRGDFRSLLNSVQSPFAGMTDMLHRHLARVGTFHQGGMVGGTRQELHVPAPRPSGGADAMRPIIVHQRVNINNSSLDATDMDETFDKKIIPRLKRVLTFDNAGLIPSLKNAVLR